MKYQRFHCHTEHYLKNLDMEDQTVPEGLNEWQQIDSPSFIDECSEFPPLDHDQGSPVINLAPLDSLSSISGLGMSSSDEEEEAEEAKIEKIEEERRWSQRLGAVGSEIIQAACKVKNHVLSSIPGLKTTNGIAILISSASSGALVFVLVSLFYMKMQRRQRRARLETTEKFMILIKEKDQRISQLLLHISQMNELLQARRKVPVIRVG